MVDAVAIDAPETIATAADAASNCIVETSNDDK